MLAGAVPSGGFGSVQSLKAQGHKPFYNRLNVASIGCGANALSYEIPLSTAKQERRGRKWNFQAAIEFEYKVPQGSGQMTEIGKCASYRRDCLA